MPEHPDPKPRAHPWRLPRSDGQAPASPVPPTRPYVELDVTTNFTFLTGASHPEEFVEQAAELGHAGASIADTNSLAGIVRAHVASREHAAGTVPLAVGCRLRFRHPEAPEVLVYPTSRDAYARLCHLLTVGKRRAPKGECHLDPHDLLEHQEGLLALIDPPEVVTRHTIETITGLTDRFDTLEPGRVWLLAARPHGHDDLAHLHRLGALAEHVRLPLVASNRVRYHTPERRPLQDVLTCIKHGCTLEQAGARLDPNGERHLKPADEMVRLFAHVPWGMRAIDATVEILQRASAFSLDQIRYEYPDEICPHGRTPMQHLIELTRQGARERYPDGVPDTVQAQIDHELALIEELDYAPYFLTCHDIVRFARSRGILCQGRGAAANSAVCYCLAVTAVDPSRISLLFERFVSKERDEPPDIDIDFEHERREEVIQYLYAKYGRERAALTAEVITYRGRSAIREVGKALGLSLDCVDRLAKSLDWWDSGVVNTDRLRELGLNPDERALAWALELAGQIVGFPRHLSQHVGGFVITRAPLCELVPIENAAMPDRTVIEWDKDDIDAMGMLKIDVLGLGMLTCIRKAFELINEAPGTDDQEPIRLHNVPAEDPEVYDMICRADTIGVFQIESRAQMQMLPRLRPRCYYDLVIQVAIVRPGPIQGNMVHPYLRRRNGEEPVEYPDKAVERVLGKTLGVPLFQEQAMQMAIVAAGFTPGEADQLRRAMAAWKRKGDRMVMFGRKLMGGMIANGYAKEYAERCFEQLKGFSEYGFPESHAASFALLVYVSCWLKHHHPATFATALINSQPMGFYRPAQIIRDAQDHGVDVRPIDINHSEWDCTLEWNDAEHPAIRLGMRLVKGLSHDDALAIIDARNDDPFRSIDDLWRRARTTPVRALRQLARADAFTSLRLDRQAALWQMQQLRDEVLPLLEPPPDEPPPDEPAPRETPEPDTPEPHRLPEISLPTTVAYDYAATGLSLKAHPVSFIRPELAELGVTPNRDLLEPEHWPHARPVAVAGITLVRQRPATASGVVFITLEDESGVINLILRPKIYETHRRAARHAVVLIARGTVERGGPNNDVVHVMVRTVEDAADAVSTSRTNIRPLSRDFR